MDIRLQKISSADTPFLYQVYASTRAEEVAQTGWPVQQQQAFLKQQFDAQHQHYQKHYPEASFDVIYRGKEAVGRLYVSRWENEIRIVDIAILSQYRGENVGTSLLKQLIEEAKHSDKVLSIHVEKNNPARQWYLKLGFKEVEDKGVYVLMVNAFSSHA